MSRISSSVCPMAVTSSSSASSGIAWTSRISCQALQSVTFTTPYRLRRSFTGAKESSSSLESTTEAPASAVPCSLTSHSGAPRTAPPEQAAEAASAASTGWQLALVCASPATTRRPRSRCLRASAGERSMMTYSKAAAQRRQTGGATPSSFARTHCWMSEANCPEPAPISTTRKGARSWRYIHITKRSRQKTRAKCGESAIGYVVKCANCCVSSALPARARSTRPVE
mmetsp:Transcript_148790/g.414546  ORF Transcript_148790/g.414546 Transcript_148790/m.414546 type:complete len:227 (+) Transcript_148790:300-980(+)